MLLIKAIEQWVDANSNRLVFKDGRTFSPYDALPNPEDKIKIDFQLNEDPTPNIIWVG